MTERKRVLVCANPDLNYIDGSSIWAQTITLALAETGQASVDFLARCSPVRDELFSPLDRHRQINVIDGPVRKDKGRASLHRLSLSEMARLAVQMDREQDYDLVIVRGYKIAQALKHNSHFLAKCWLYLTDIPQNVTAYDVTELKEISDIARGCHRLLCQSQGFVRLWKELVPDLPNRKFLLYTPVIPDADQVLVPIAERSRIAIYAGKFSPDWKTLDMAEAWAEVHRKYPDAALQMIGEKIHSDGAGFQSRMRMALKETPGLEWLGAMSRERVQDHLRQARVGLSWRSDRMNDTLEYSTKILEYGGAGCAAIMNRNPLHEDLLGEDYPLFANSQKEFIKALEIAIADDALAQNAANRMLIVAHEHVFSNRVSELRNWMTQMPSDKRDGKIRSQEKLRVLIAGHDMKFFTPLARRLEETGQFEFLIDHWQGHNRHDEARSHALIDKADIIICEWCLGNVTWYSKHKRSTQRLLVRFHAQELRTNYLNHADWNAIDLLVFVAPHIQRQFHDRCSHFPRSIQEVIPNFVDSTKFVCKEKQGDALFTLGLVGYVPKLKRLDRAVDLLEKLLEQDTRFKLRVKGRNPFQYNWMRSREEECAFYESLFERINGDRELRNRVIFDPHGDDVDDWFRLVGHILSPSDQESFHLALAEGALTGCNPVVWQRDGAGELWPKKTICADTAAAASSVLEAISEFTNYRSIIQKDYTESVVLEWQRCLLNLAPSEEVTNSFA